MFEKKKINISFISVLHNISISNVSMIRKMIFFNMLTVRILEYFYWYRFWKGVVTFEQNNNSATDRYNQLFLIQKKKETSM